MLQSLFLDYVQRNHSEITNNLNLIGDILLVEKIKFPEKRVGGIILASPSKNLLNTMTADEPNFYRVLLTGKGFYDDETKQDVPLECSPGDVILTGAVSVRMFSSFPMMELAESDVLGIARFGDVLWHWKGVESFCDFLTHMNLAAQNGLELRKAVGE